MAGSASNEDGEMGFQIAPMVDVVFVLLLFFMACAGFRAHEKELAVGLPSSAGKGPSETVITIEIASDGTVTMNDTVYGRPMNRDLSELKSWLRTVATDFGGIDPVIIRPAPDARQERIIDVLNACAAGGVKKLTFG